MFFSCHDPSSSGRQGEDVGQQYRSVLGCTTNQQHQVAELAVSAALRTNPAVSTEVIIVCTTPAGGDDDGSTPGHAEDLGFHVADDEHQNYYDKNGASSSYCSLVVWPKLEQMHNNPDICRLMTDQG